MVELTSTEDVRGSRVADRLAEVRERIASAARKAGRDASSIRLMAVTKGFPVAVVQDAIGSGLALFGENRVQEAELKYLALPGTFELHLIGHLQRNKARPASGLFACVQSIDKEETAAALEAQCAARGRTMDVLIEVNTSGESSKSGFPARGEALAGAESIARMAHLRVRGLMTVGPLSEDQRLIRASFAALRSLYEEIRSGGVFPFFDTLSMGMSGDFEAAIEEGSTLVRVGTALFGQRVPL